MEVKVLNHIKAKGEDEGFLAHFHFDFKNISINLNF